MGPHGIIDFTIAQVGSAIAHRKSDSNFNNKECRRIEFLQCQEWFLFDQTHPVQVCHRYYSTFPSHSLVY